MIVWCRNLFWLCAVPGVLCLLVSIGLYFRWKIRNVIGYLSGRRARKQIRRLLQGGLFLFLFLAGYGVPAGRADAAGPEASKEEMPVPQEDTSWTLEISRIRNDGGFCASDSQGRYYFAEFLEVTMEVKGEGAEEILYLKRNGEKTAELTPGEAHTEYVFASGRISYGLERRDGSPCAPELVMEAVRAEEQSELKVSFGESSGQVGKLSVFSTPPEIFVEGKNSAGIARLDYTEGAVSEEWNVWKDWTEGEGSCTALEHCLFQEYLKPEELEDGVHTLRFRAVSVTGKEEIQSLTFCLDRISPVILEDYGNGNWDEEQSRYISAEAVSLGLRLRESGYRLWEEEGCSPEPPAVEILGADSKEITVRDWELCQGEWDARWEGILPAGKGEEREYAVRVSYEDPAGNSLTLSPESAGSIEEGRFQSAKILVDQKPPELLEFSVKGALAWERDGKPIYANRLEKEDVSISFILKETEAYWNPDGVEVWIRNEEGQVVAGTSPEDSRHPVLELGWTDNGELHRGELGFDGETGKAGLYQVTVVCRDRAGNLMVDGRSRNEGGTLSQGSFVSTWFGLDHQAPVFEIDFSEAHRLTDGRNQDVEVKNGDISEAVTAYYGKRQGKIQCWIRLREDGLALEDGRIRDCRFLLNGQEIFLDQWKKEEENWVHSFEVDRDGSYRILFSCSDAAGNEMCAEPGKAEAGFVNEKGVYESIALVLDTESPVLRAEFSEPSVNQRDGKSYFDRNLYLKLQVEDRNIRYKELQEELLKLQVSDLAGDPISGTATETYLRGLDPYGAPDGEAQCWKVMVPLFTEGQYEIPVCYCDLAGNPAVWSTVLSFVVDRTAPETLDFEYSVHRKGDYGIFGFLFARERLKITAVAGDEIAGIQKIRYTIVEAGGRQQIREFFFLPDGTCRAELEIPLKGSSFKGSVRTEAFDWAGNSVKEEKGCIVENSILHEKTQKVEIRTHTSPGRTVGGRDYYNSDVELELLVEDSYSGIGSLAYTAGNTLSGGEDYRKEADAFPGKREITESYTKKLVLPAALNHKNEVRVFLEYEDNAGYAGHAEAFYRIDVTAPVLTVDYQEEESENGFYSSDRIAKVTVQERNFDPADVEFLITSTEGAMPLIGPWSSEGSGDERRHTCEIVFSEDGTYTFTAAFQDLAGNRADYSRIDQFTIDKTEPVLSVRYDNDRSRNEFYYADSRTAFLEIREQNFDSGTMEMAVQEKTGKEVPVLSGWSHQGELHRAQIRFEADGTYEFSLKGTDLAGNRMEEYQSELFVIDHTPPELEISGIEDCSANSETAALKIRCFDEHYDPESLSLILGGFRNGILKPAGDSRQTETGMEFAMNDFPYIPEADDMYRLELAVRDLAGNLSEKGIRFSVNRFGSVYTFDEKTDRLAGEKGVYYTRKEQDLTVTETNVDTLEFREIVCNRNGELSALIEGRDYTVHMEGSENGWRQYTYRIPAKQFSEEGFYAVTIYSEDRAANASDNISKGKKLEFAVDKTAPDIRISGVEQNGRYREAKRRILMDIQENIRLKLVEVKINGKETVYTGAELERCGGRIELWAEGSGNWQKLSVTAKDEAGNIGKTGEICFLLTPNLVIQFLHSDFLVTGAAALAGSFAAAVLFWKMRKRRRAILEQSENSENP